MPSHKTKKIRSNGADGDRRTRPTTGSYFLSLELENVRCFAEKQRLDLSVGNGRPAKWTILLGENGTGKTTILQVLATFSISEPISFGKSRQPRSRALSLLFISQRDTLIRNIPQCKSQVYCETIQKTRLLGKEADSFHSIVRSEMEVGEWNTQLIKPLTVPSVLPTCFAYSVERRLSSPSINQQDPIDTADGLFLDTSSVRDAEGWLLGLDYSASKPSRVQRQQEKHLEMVKDVLVKVLPDVSEIRFNASSGVWPTPSVEFKTPDGWVPLRQLGYGYRATIAWIVDLASRMVECYPDSLNPLAEPAVVLVDEIDLHLHPKWQRGLIGFLTERFPNTQFIVTAHSPLIVQAATDANIALLKREGDHVVIENHPETIRGWRIDQVLTSELFGLETARPPDMEKLILKRKELLTKPRLTKADKKKLEEFDDQLGQIPQGESFEQAKKTMELIEKSLKLIEKYQGTKS
jgi:predicted ATP-binding protein involved in virulence